MPMQLALTGTTVQTEALHEMTKIKRTMLKCYRALEIYVSGQVDYVQWSHYYCSFPDIN